MFRLILMRHAKSDWSMSDPDHDRPLNPRGRASAQALGDWLRAQDLIPDQALVSSSRRTQETFERLNIAVPLTSVPEMYHAEPETLWEVLRSATGRSLLMIGHNPGIAAFALSLCRDLPEHPRFLHYPTGATLVAEFDIPNWQQTKPGMGRALEFVVPRELI